MNESIEIYLFRHGRSLCNEIPRIVTGRSTPSPLVAQGVAEARRLGEILMASRVAPNVVYASPAVRAIRTAEIVIQRMGLSTAIVRDERLHEQDFGDWVGRMTTDIFAGDSRRIIEACGKAFRPPNGESMNDIGKRMMSWLKDVSSGNASAPATVFAFTHAGAIRALASALHSWSHAQTYQTLPSNTSVSLIRCRSGAWRFEYVGRDAAEVFLDGE
jgi:broad specificity phosphatase PhoE